MLWKSWLSSARGEKSFQPAADYFLRQLEHLYAYFSRRQLRKREQQKKSYPVPILSVGNITLGGTGKTSIVMAIGERFSQQKEVVVLHNRYGAAKKSDRFLVAMKGELYMSAEEAGEEALLLGQALPKATVLAHPNREKIATYAYQVLNPDLFLIDDGFQQRSFSSKVDVVLIDAQCPFGNGALFPRGILREPIDSLQRAHLIVITKADLVSKERRERLIERLAGITIAPCFLARYRVIGWELLSEKMQMQSLFSGRAALLAGLGYPDGFVQTVRGEGLSPKKAYLFPDHHLYTKRDISFLNREYQEGRFTHLITTAKDALKLKKYAISFPIWIVKVVMEIEPRFYSALDKQLYG